MDNLRTFSFLLCALSFLFLIAGLFKPWLLLWWEDTQTRKKVIQVYGSISLIALLGYWILDYLIKAGAPAI
ncbi:MAG: hypothetical protein K1X47_14040 [Cyclobacteriaceae bacterium]|nr:hypothetical protein [Cyclobacteriaceae bacterium]